MAIDFAKHLNPAQLQAVQHDAGPLLVIAGAGSGKTRTIVFRLEMVKKSGGHLCFHVETLCIAVEPCKSAPRGSTGATPTTRRGPAPL